MTNGEWIPRDGPGPFVIRHSSFLNRHPTAPFVHPVRGPKRAFCVWPTAAMPA